MKIEQANSSDLLQIMEVIEYAKKIMHENGNSTQWVNGYPSAKIIADDIENKHAYIILNNDEIVGYFCFFKGKDPEVNYKAIKQGNWINNAPYGVIHRLASNGKEKGIAQFCFDFCFNQINNIKVDTHEKNIPMQKFFLKIGFSYCGIINMNDGSERKAYQKSI